MVADHQVQDGVPQELEPLVVVAVAAPGLDPGRPVDERGVEERPVPEPDPQPHLQLGQLGVPLGREGVRAHRGLRITRVALCPPNPKALDMAASTRTARGALGT